MELTRRRLLATATVAGAGALAGCTGGCRGSIPFVDPGIPADGELATEPVGSTPPDATVVEFVSLPDPERALVRTAVEEGVVRTCMTRSGGRADALRSFADRSTVPSTYLAYDGARYGLWLRIEDTLRASTADSPPDGADPCC